MTRGRDSDPNDVALQPSWAVVATLVILGALLALIAVTFAGLMLLFGHGPEGGGPEASDYVWLGALSLAAIGLFVSAFLYLRRPSSQS